MMRQAVSRWCLVAVLVGCGSVTAPPPGGETSVLEITTDRTVYSLGEDGSVRVTNKTVAQVIIAGLCQPVVDRWDGSLWGEVGATGAGGCLPVSRILRPGQGSDTPFTLDAPFDPGYFRLRFEDVSDSVTGLLPELERVSGTFEVR